ncbi:MAG: sulfatase-like hydrolase/transferase [Pseudomonadaceae bacterium]|nr:sulfatase-like hydrolase/transferase [Pseudomonadaceae bacterium]
MKRFLVIVLALIAAGIWAFSQYWYYLPGIISGIVDPVGEHRQVVWQSGPTEPAGGEQPPNIILIVADDLGFNDITFYGGGIADGTVPTPNIDAIAEQGIHFTNGYAGNGTCAPSRAALLTGRFATRSGFEFTPARPEFARLTAGDGYIADNAENYPPSDTLGLPGSELTLAELLAQRGYHSVALGKWHLGEAEGYRPLDQGFNEFLGFLPGAAMFLPEDDANAVNSKQDFDPIDRFLWPNLSYAVRHNNSGRFHPNSHMTDYFSRHAVKVIEANRNRPFFLYLAYNAPHTPLQAEKADYDALAHITGHTERTYAGMLRGLDRGIGQVLKALDDNGIADNTMVIFTSDNGGAGYVGLPDLNKPYRGWKITFFEGGIRAPYFFRWPERIPAGSQYDPAVAHIDIFATALAAAGLPVPDDRTIDGVDVLDYAITNPRPLRRPLFWRTGGYKVVQQDGWKLQLQEQNGKTWLFNLNVDPTETINLSETNPDRLAKLKALLYRLDEQMVEPLWPALVETPISIDHTIDTLPETDHETILWTN